MGRWPSLMILAAKVLGEHVEAPCRPWDGPGSRSAPRGCQRRRRLSAQRSGVSGRGWWCSDGSMLASELLESACPPWAPSRGHPAPLLAQGGPKLGLSPCFLNKKRQRLYRHWGRQRHRHSAPACQRPCPFLRYLPLTFRGPSPLGARQELAMEHPLDVSYDPARVGGAFTPIYSGGSETCPDLS